jgi:competence ComEA-like helix-hairpin-helix protein
MTDWKQLLTFTKQERNGIAVLCVLLAGALAYFFLQPVLFQAATVPTEIPAGYYEQLNAPKNTEGVRVEKEKHEVDVAFMAGQRSLYQQNELFLFNPNGLAESDWIRLGLSPAQARSVKNFEAKGGSFRTKEDVKKLYVISPQKYKELESYIVIPQRSDSTFVKKEKAPLVIELNTADTSMLVKVNGIGSAFAQRIVAYRAMLGGFHSKEQLLEVYGMDQEKYAQIEPSLTCNPTYVTKINVNTAQVADLKKHPYFTPNTASALVNYRKQHGSFRQLQDIMQCKVITPELFEKLSPYLTL